VTCVGVSEGMSSSLLIAMRGGGRESGEFAVTSTKFVQTLINNIEIKRGLTLTNKSDTKEEKTVFAYLLVLLVVLLLAYSYLQKLRHCTH